MIVFSTLGASAIDVAGHRLTPAAERMFAAVLYLAVERGREVPRGVVQELIFPDVKNGWHSLRQVLYQLRRLGLDIGRDPTHLRIDSSIVADPVAAIVSRNGAAKCLSDDTLRSVAGGYLPGYAPVFSEAFSEWFDRHRSAVSIALLRALGGELAAARAALDWPRVQLVARACLALDSMHEEATLLLAEHLAIAGSKSEAVGMIDRLLDDIGPAPKHPIRLPAAVLRRRISERVPEPYGTREPPLVGRDGELREMAHFLESRHSDAVAESGETAGPTMLMLVGSAGIGKTRLLQRAERMAAVDGLSVVRIAVQPHYV